MNIRNLIGKVAAFGIVPKIPTFINALLLPIVTQYLTLYDYGIWGIISSLNSLFICIVPLGFHIHLANYYFETNRWKLFWSKLFYVMMASGMFSAIIYIGVIFTQLTYVTLLNRFLIAVISCLPILLFAPSIVSQQLYTLSSKPWPLVSVNLISGIASILITFSTIVYFKGGYWGWVLGSVIGAIVSFLLFIFKLNQANIRPSIERNVKRIKRWLKISFPAIPHALGMMFLSSSARIIMSLFHIPVDEIGIYTNGYIMGDYVTIISTSTVVALVPQIQLAYRNHNFRKYRLLYYGCQSMTIITVFIVAIWMPQIYLLVVRNPELQIASSVASLICFANVLVPLYNFLSFPVYINRETIHLLWLMFIPGCFNLVLCLTFIPIYGYMAAVYCTLFSYWSLIFVPYISKFHRREVKKWMKINNFLFIILLIIGLVILSNILKMESVYVKVIISCIILIFGYICYVKLKSKINAEIITKENIIL